MGAEVFIALILDFNIAAWLVGARANSNPWSGDEKYYGSID